MSNLRSVQFSTALCQAPVFHDIPLIITSQLTLELNFCHTILSPSCFVFCQSPTTEVCKSDCYEGFILYSFSRASLIPSNKIKALLLSPFSTRRIYSCERKIHQRDWLAKTFAFSSTNHVAEFCVRANKFA